MCDQCAILPPEAVRGDAKCRYGPGHLGELTSYLPVELVDAVLAETRTVQQRLRCLPSRVGVYFVLALGLFPSLRYLRVWDKLTAGLPGQEVHRPSEKALRDLRRRLGPAPMKALFEVLAGPLAQPRTPGVCYRRWRTVAFDGCSSIKVPDRERNRSWLGRPNSGWGWAGYPLVRLMVLCETGTRGLLGAVFGPTRNGEMSYAGQLMPLLSPRMLALADRAFDANDFLDAVSKTGAMFLIRLNPRRRPAVLAVLSDGSYLTRFGALRVRVIDADITVTTSDGTRLRDHYRLATSLLDHQSDPADTLIHLYHERWEIESAYYALRHTLLDGHVLRSADPVGLEQELWAQLTLYQALRVAMVEAVESVPGTDPDRASFTIALETARSQTAIAHTHESATALGSITRAVLAGLLPKRRPRTSQRKVKSPTSRYATASHNDQRPPTSQSIVSLTIGIHDATRTPPIIPTPQHDQRRVTRGPGRTGDGPRNQTLQLMRAAPDRVWHRNTGRESGDPVCERMLARIATDENLHMVFYRNLLAAALDLAPDLAMVAIRDVVVDFRMPGHGMPGFERAAARMGIGGIYNLRVHHDDVLLPVLRHLKVLERDGLGPEGLRAQEELGLFMDGLNAQAVSFDERREALLARRQARA